MTNTKKMTKRDYFQILRNSYPTSAPDYDQVIAFIDHELDLLTRKNTTQRKPTHQQLINEDIKTAILNGMEPNRLYTISEIQAEIPECNDLKGQRITALLTQLKDACKVVRTQDKRKAYYSLAVVGE